MLWGIPIVPFILVAGSTMIASMWVLMGMGFYAMFVVLSSGLMVLLFMKAISKDDPHKLNRILMRVANTRYRANSRYWNGHSVSPIDYTKRK